eukprot:CAMPEP_0197834406 /NCGR_PEP_ID=MMETSP1437-20131217/22249_1 /TAXON_ID=49252 ORGANISM="Eucampia antarctica, Strain CCMP1452" /NCGR_SAMPLE_ID=MMETSP1437 /ASSEMBLY_ACC=CAM_ASM_001096 /LENGTH=92 /DNA_ID=CAMNT_0043439053 /DNA_START=68 /DNA_END=342 /DNA_ORIENTATION=-
MAFPVQSIVMTTPEWVFQKSDHWGSWQNYLYRRIYPVAEMLGINQDVWSLYGGDYGGGTDKVSVDATLKNGTIVKWQSPNWQDLGRWEHKRL